MPDDDDTTPDLRRLKCPECAGKGYVEITPGYRTGCGVCWGKRYVSREEYDRWRRRSGNSDD